MVTVDLDTHEVTQAQTDLYTKANRTALGLSDAISGGAAPVPDAPRTAVGLGLFQPRTLADLAVSPDGRQVYGATLWASQAVLDGQTKPGESPIEPGGTSGGGAYGGGPCSGGAVTAAGVATFVVDEQTTPTVDDVSRCFETEDKPFPGSVLRAADAIQGPVAMAVDPTGDWLFVVNRESDNVAVLPTSRSLKNGNAAGVDISSQKRFFAPTSSVRDVVRVGAGPNGIALTQDGSKAYVFNSFDHTVSTLALDANKRVTNTGRTLVVAQDVLPSDVVAGRKLFFSATDSRMNNPATGIACASCHAQGREDGHVWNFAEGPRQTPSLAGRRTGGTAPFHWSGEFVNLGDFLSHTVRLRMGGSGATPAMEAQLLAFIDSMQAPDNPHKLGVPSEAQVRGASVFVKANCNSCHAGEALTNNTFANVGTLVSTGDVRDDAVKLRRGLNTPSLLAVARTGPYLHDGSAPTLKERLLKDQAKDLHGRTSQLNAQEMDDLVEYLKSL